MPRTAPRLRLERLDPRLAPAVGAYDVPADITGRFSGVVQFGDGTDTTGSTGTLLADGRHILTAAHCITTVPGRPTVPAVGVTVRFDLPEENGGLRRIQIAVPKEGIFVHPDWTGDVNKGDDVAILRLPVIAPFGNGPNSIAYPLFTGAGEPGRAFTFVGYGATGTGTTGQNDVDFNDNDAQRLTVRPGAGPFKLAYNGVETAELRPDAGEKDIVDALSALPALADAGVSVLRLGGAAGNPVAFDISLAQLPRDEFRLPIEVVETGPAGLVTVTPFPASDGGSAQVVRLTVDPAAGPTLTLGFAGRSVTVPSSATPDEVEVALRELIEVDGQGVRRVEVGLPPGTTGVYEITFRNVDYAVLRDKRIPRLTASGAGSAAVLLANDVEKVKRSGTNTFLPTAELAGNLDATMTEGSNPGTALLGSGDSGGPAFLDGRVAGIASYGNGVSGFGDTSSWARVSAFLPYIYDVTQLDRTAKTAYRAVLDLSVQPLSAGPHSVQVRQADGVVTVTVDNVVYFREPAANLSGLEVIGVPGPTVVLRGAGLTVPLAVTNATEVIEPVLDGPPAVPPAPPPFVPPPPVPTRTVAVAAGFGGAPRVDVFSPDGTPARSFFAYDESFAGGVQVAVGDVTGDGVADVVTAAGAGGGPHVKVFDGLTGAEAFSFFAFEPTALGGLSLAVGDLDGDGVPSIVVGAGAGGGPRVDVFDVVGGELRRTASFFAFEPTFAGGVNVAVADGRVVVGAGVGGGPVVATFTPAGAEVGRVFAFAPTYSGGVDVAAIDGLIAAAPGPGGGSAVQLFAPDLTPTRTVRTFDPAPAGGLSVAVKPGDSGVDLFVGPGAGAAGEVRRYAGPDYARFDVLQFDAGFSGGVFVG